MLIIFLPMTCAVCLLGVSILDIYLFKQHIITARQAIGHELVFYLVGVGSFIVQIAASIRWLLSKKYKLALFSTLTVIAFFVFILIALVIGLMGLFLLKLPLSKIIIIIGWLILSGLVLFSLMLFICLLMPNKKAASVVTSAMVFPMMMLGGSFFPFEAMPVWMAGIGQYLPNGYMLQKFNLWFIDDGLLNVLITPAIIATVFFGILWFINKSLLAKFARA